MTQSIARTIAAYERRNKLRTEKGRPRHYLTTPEGRTVTEDHFGPPLAAFIRGDLELKPLKPPSNLGPLLYSLDAETLAVIGLMPLLDGWARGWDWKNQSHATVCLEVGRHLEARIGKELTDKERVLAGEWLVECATTMDYFDYDKAGFPIIAKDWEPYVKQCREQLLLRHPIHLPHTAEPPPWTQRRERFPGRMPETFVRDWRPETRKEIEQAFKDPNWEHAKAINALRLVPLEIDPMIADLVAGFSTEIKKRGWKRVKSEGGRKYWLDQWSAHYNLVAADLAESHYLIGKPFWLTYNCDKRGRVYSLQHFHYGREDHVRAMFRFHNGMQLGKEGLYWLAVHVANTHGETDKLPWNERVAWVAKHLPTIEQIAANPAATFKLWCGKKVDGLWEGVDKPFAFVAACREYVTAKSDPENFITHLPVSFDHTCSGIQHLSMICRDEKGGALVNLTDSDRPQDVYMAVALKLKAEVNAADDESAAWWKAILPKLTDRQIRKLLKQAVMTYGYAAEKNSRQMQIARAYYDLRFADEVPEGVFGYLATQAEKVIEELLPSAARFMRWMKDLAKYHAERGNVLTWTSPTNFPVRNAYHISKDKRVSVQRNGIKIRFKLGDGATNVMLVPKTIRSAPANFTHSMDASHLCRVVNAATDAHESINDILVVHDSFACHAPHAVRLNQLIRGELGLMYQACDPIRRLCANNPSDLEPPPLGSLDPLDIQNAEWICI